MTAQVINVAIVLVGVYVALGVACSFIQEQIAAGLQMRPRILEQGVKELLSRDLPTLERLTQHPLVSNASADSKKSQFPSYIDPRNFSMAFWQTLESTAAGAATASLASLGTASANPKDVVSRLISQINAWAPTTEGPMRIKQSATALLTAAEGDFDRLLAVTDYWFNAKMDRVAGDYKRKAQYFLIAISFAIAVICGIDSIDLGRQLLRTPTITEPIAQAMFTAVSQNPKDAAQGIASVNKAILETQNGQALRFSRWFSGPPFDGSAVLGLFITGLAGALGAPFWFDVLKSIVNVRMAGAKPLGVPPLTTQPAVAAGSAPEATQFAGTIRGDTASAATAQ